MRGTYLDITPTPSVLGFVRADAIRIEPVNRRAFAKAGFRMAGLHSSDASLNSFRWGSVASAVHSAFSELGVMESSPLTVPCRCRVLLEHLCITTTFASTPAATYSRAVGVISASGTYSRVATGSSAFDGNNVRSAVSDGHNFWLAGTASATGNSGIWYSGGGGVPVQVGSGNYRNANIASGNLYVSTSAGTTPGVSGFSGLPTGAATSSLLLA